MIRIQESFANNTSTLYLVSTPIGNLSDITYRAVEKLKKVNGIYAEDTRVSRKLLDHYQIKTQIFSYHDHSSEAVTEEIITKLSEHQNIALISDAGTPLISDPGFNLVKKVIGAGFNVVAIPGASAMLPALVTSGLIIAPFVFIGFLPRRKSDALKILGNYQNRLEAVVLYESPNRISNTLAMIKEILGNRNISLAREITKKFETITTFNLADLSSIELSNRGEYVIVIEGETSGGNFKGLSIPEHIHLYASLGYSEMEAMKKVAKDLNVSKSDIYKIYKT